MSLYIIPESTNSTAADGQEYGRHHDLGPHPNLRHLDRQPAQVRLDDFLRQVRLFESMYGVRTRTVRNHCVVWVGYTAMAEAMARAGIRMEGNFNYGSYARVRQPGPYTGWGAAMPLRFCDSAGCVIDVRQQHTHIGDDEAFSDLPQTFYSYRLDAAVYSAMVRRILGDNAERFHVPYAVNIHPSNWGRFSRGQSEALLNEAARRKLPVWSFDQWSIFCDQRDTWQLESWQWNGHELRCRWQGQPCAAELCGLLPMAWHDSRLTRLTVNGTTLPIRPAERHFEAVALFPLPSAAERVDAVALYQAGK